MTSPVWCRLQQLFVRCEWGIRDLEAYIKKHQEILNITTADPCGTALTATTPSWAVKAADKVFGKKNKLLIMPVFLIMDLLELQVAIPLGLLLTDHAFCVGKSLGEYDSNYCLIMYWQLRTISSLSANNPCTLLRFWGWPKKRRSLDLMRLAGVFLQIHQGICREVFVHRGIAVDSRGICLWGIWQGQGLEETIFMVFTYLLSLLQRWKYAIQG